MDTPRSSSDLNDEAKERVRRRTYLVDASLLLLFILLLLAELFLLIRRRTGSAVEYSSQASIRAGSKANYGFDGSGLLVPPFDEKIFEQLIADMPAKISQQDRVSTLQASLLTPVATMTYGSSAVSATQTASPTPSAPPSSTLGWTPTPRVTPSQTVASGSTTAPTSAATGTNPPLLPTLPPIFSTNPPLPTVPITAPTIPPILPTSVPPLTLPTLPPLP